MVLSVETLYIAAAVGFIGKFAIRKVPSFWLHALVNLPGVIAHEIMHLLVAFITLARPISFSVIPRRDGEKWVFGSVQCARLTHFNAFPVAMAPALLLLVPYALGESLKGVQLSIQEAGLVCLLTAIICQAAIPSGQDFKVAASKWFGSMMWALAIGYSVINGIQ